MRQRTPAKAILPMVPLLALFAVVLLLLGSLGGLVAGIIVSVVGTGAAVGYLLAKLSRPTQANVLRFFPHGVQWASGGGITPNVGWADLTGIGEVHTQLASGRTVVAGGIAAVGAGSMSNSGLHGWSAPQLPPRVPLAMQQAMARRPRDPASGKLHIGIPVALFDPAWFNGPIGAWVRQYRPDLFQC